MKLHLGCGQRYLKGYINIDFPKSKHSIQDKSIADIQANILDLKYAQETVGEIRLHHVFEHFTRPTACALLFTWRNWLKKNGIVRIEVPDFDKTVRNILNPLASDKKKAVALRHIFGSNEAEWAVHFEGWSVKRLGNLLKILGFDIIEVKKNSWKGTYNFEIFAQKNIKKINKNEAESIVRNFLANFLVDKSSSEKKLLEVWMGMYKNQLEKGVL
ncbi:MAG: hypothetical protein M1142_01690 [Patescibacteria group bacterium]|nr:hypothetical protein [Patescibacteria group bacterium]